MPANLTPQYLEAERKFREARSTEEKVAALEEMLAVMPKHKGTDKLKAMLRRKLAQFQDNLQKHGGGRRGHDPYRIRKEGAGQVALYGLPNTGKSSLVSRLTKAACPVADWPFTTHLPTPGMMAFENIQIQLVDLPPLMDDDSETWLPRVLSAADALAFILDAGEDAAAQMDVLVEGLREMSLYPPTAGERLRGFICLNKADLAPDLSASLASLASWPFAAVAASTLLGTGLEDFRREAFRALGIIRVYTKAPHEKPDFDNPIVLPAGSTLERAAAGLHKDFVRKMKYARIWGEGLFDGQMVGRDHPLHDRDVVEFHV